MSTGLRLALSSLNPVAGALRANAGAILAMRKKAAREGADLLVAPQGSLCGHPLLDLARDATFRGACEAVLAELAATTGDGGPDLLVSAPALEGGGLRDMLFLLGQGCILARRARHAVTGAGDPFEPGPAPGPVSWRGVRLGIMAGDDLHDPSVAETLAESGAELLLCAGASAVTSGPERDMDIAVARVVETGLPLAWTGQWGGQGEDMFAGGGFVLNADRSLALRLPSFSDALAVTEWNASPDGWRCEPRPLPPLMLPEARLWQALALGVADQVRKAGLSGAVVPLTGGLGPLLVAACAREALGARQVLTVAVEPAHAASADALGLACEVLPLSPALAAFGPLPGGGTPDMVRHLGQLAFAAFAQSRGALLLHGLDRTALLLGDIPHTDGFAPLKGLYSSTLQSLARSHGLALSAPTPDAATDAILEALADQEQPVEAVVARGFPRAQVVDLWRRMHQGGYKRRQAPPGLILGRRRDCPDPLNNGLTDPIP